MVCPVELKQLVIDNLKDITFIEACKLYARASASGRTCDCLNIFDLHNIMFELIVQHYEVIMMHSKYRWLTGYCQEEPDQTYKYTREEMPKIGKKDHHDISIVTRPTT
ncbi:unnamed protein product [Rotaria socialis]